MIINPNKYELSKKVNADTLLKHGFVKRGGTYHAKIKLYSLIYLEIEIDLVERWMTYFVKSTNYDSYYTPFYLPDTRIQYEGYNKVAKRFNDYMDHLCRVHIMWRPDFLRPNKQILQSKRRKRCLSK
jgi:hypothetical protein